MEFWAIAGLIVLGVNVLLTILNGVMLVRVFEGVNAIREGTKPTSTPIPE